MVWVDRKTQAKTRKSLAWAMAVALAFGCFGGWPFDRVPRAAAAAEWPASSLTGLNMPFGPADSLVTTQNPPDFRWPAIGGADQYHLQVSRSSTVADVVYENDTLTANYYNFPHVFDAGTWYWRVKYHKPSEGWSEWSTVRKFRIEEQNVPFPVPPVEDIMSSIGAAHPRIWTTSDSLAEFRSLAQTTGKTIYESKLASVNANLNKPLPPEPDFPYDPSHPRDKEYTDALTKLRSDSDNAVNMMADAAFLYLVTGEEKFGKEARRRLNGIALWNPDGDTGYAINDQVHRYIALKSAMAYDWIYDFPELTDDDKAAIRNMVAARTNTMVTDLTSTHKIWENPYDSHGWTNFGYIGIIAIALLHDADAAEDWFRDIVPAYINIMPPWGGEDGGWSQGTGYWQYSSMFGKEFTDVLLSASGFNLYDKAYSRNEGLYPLYMFPHGSPGGVFGDGSEDSPGRPSVSIYNRLAQMYGDPRYKWEAEAIGSGSGDELANYFYGDDGLSAMPPVDLPDGRWFQDTGMVAMHSELYDPDRVSLYFKSSPYGSFNHSHADQNSFVVKAFGESLAVESGFYDEYFTDHDKFYGKQTLASNAITYDGKKGQPIDNIHADGKITGFVTHPDFDATSGDATAAYMGALTQANRKIIYVRPSMFVVIDQLATANPSGSEFEWRLHADDELDLDADQAGATILKGNAALKVRLHSPTGLRTTYEDKFIDQNGVERPPGGDYAGREQKHAAFITPKTTATTIVTTMEAYERDGVPQQVAAENHGDYMKLPFADGSVVYVRMGTSGVVNADNLTFDGAAVAVKGDTVLLADGKKVVKDGVTLIESSEPATVVYGKDRLSVSSQAETQLAVHAPGLTRLRDADSGEDIPQGGTAAESMALRGAYWTASGDTLNVQAEQGQRAFKLNDAPMPEPMSPVTLQTEIDGVPGTITLQRHSDTEGNPVAWGKLGNASGLYLVEEAPPGFLFAGHGRPDSVYLEADASIILRGAPGVVKLKKMGADDPSETVLWENPDEMRETTPIVWKEAESYTASGDQSFTVYTTRKFLSGGAGIANWVTEGSWGKWQLNVPKTGTYDLVLKYVSGWGLPEGTQTSRLAMIGDKPYYFETPTTVDWGTLPENWRGVRVKTGQQLNAGPIDITLWTAFGPMNMDWIGLIEVKEDEELPSAPGDVQVVSQTEDSATVSWSPSTDNAAVKEYIVYANGVQQTVVPGGSLTATVAGLTTGQTYAITVRAVDSSDNRSAASAAVSVTMSDMTAPAWGEEASVRVVHLFPDTAKLAWDAATDNSGTVAAYSIYRQDQPDKAAEVTGNAYDVTGLQPGATYTFKVEAKDANGNESEDGPSVTLTMPTAYGAGEYYETFDDWPADVTNGDGWSFTRNFGTIVETVPLPDPTNRALKVLDNYADPGNEWAVSPIVQRTTTAISGKVTFETKFIANNVGYFELMIGGAGKDLIRFTAYSDGTFGYWKKINGVNTPMKIPNASFKLPKDQWMTLRFDADMDNKTYDITLQTDAFKNAAGSADDPGTLDKKAGIYRIGGLKFYDDNESVSSLNSFVFRPSRYTGQYLFDYAAMYKTNVDTIAPTTTDNAPAGWVGEDVAVDLSVNDNEGGSGTSATYYKVDGGPRQTGTTVALTTEGIHTITYWSKDRAGNREDDRTAVVKIDKTAPSLTVELDSTSIWPANHEMATVHAALNSDDDASGVASVVLTSITSNEPDSGQDDIQADIGTEADSFGLRADREGEGTGRVYTVTYTATDNAGNRTTASATVAVPHDQSDNP